MRLKAETLAHRLMCLLCTFEKKSAVCAVLKNTQKQFFKTILGRFPVFLLWKSKKRPKNDHMLTKASIKNECDVVGLSESVCSTAETLAHRLVCLRCIFEKVQRYHNPFLFTFL